MSGLTRNDAAFLAKLVAALLPLTELLEKEDALNIEMGVDRWGDDEEFLGTRLKNGLLRRVLSWSRQQEATDGQP